MDCCPPHHFILDQQNYGTCCRCSVTHQFPRAWEPAVASWHRGTKTEPKRPGRPAKAPTERVAVAKVGAAPDYRSRGRKTPGTSGYFGVTAWRQKWKVRISVDGTVQHLGVFEDPIDAARAYDEAGRKAGIGPARLNRV